MGVRGPQLPVLKGAECPSDPAVVVPGRRFRRDLGHRGRRRKGERETNPDSTERATAYRGIRDPLAGGSVGRPCARDLPSRWTRKGARRNEERVRAGVALRPGRPGRSVPWAVPLEQSTQASDPGECSPRVRSLVRSLVLEVGGCDGVTHCESTDRASRSRRLDPPDLAQRAERGGDVASRELISCGRFIHEESGGACESRTYAAAARQIPKRAGAECEIGSVEPVCLPSACAQLMPRANPGQHNVVNGTRRTPNGFWKTHAIRGLCASNRTWDDDKISLDLEYSHPLSGSRVDLPEPEGPMTR